MNKKGRILYYSIAAPLSFLVGVFSHQNPIESWATAFILCALINGSIELFPSLVKDSEDFSTPKN